MLSLLSNCDDFATLRYLKFKERDIAVCDVHGRKKATQKKPQTHDLIGHKVLWGEYIVKVCDEGSTEQAL